MALKKIWFLSTGDLEIRLIERGLGKLWIRSVSVPV